MRPQDVDRRVFLATIFEGLDPMEEAICLGRPLSDDGRSGWSADAWRDPVHAAMVTEWLANHGFSDVSGEPAYGLLERSTHFAISTFTDIDGQGFRRKRQGIVRCYALVLDDIGTKATVPDAVLAQASWRMETSPGNEQVGFMIADPFADGALDIAATVLASFSEAKMTDKSVTDLTRYVRLPGSLPNGKKHEARLISWTPRPIAPLSLIAAAGIETVSVRAITRTDNTIRAVDKPVTDNIADWLEAQDMVLQEEADGWLQITCPWIDEHGDRPDTGTKYKPATHDGTRAFKCWHSSCEDRGTKDFMDWVEAQVELPPAETVREFTVGRRISVYNPQIVQEGAPHDE